MYKIVTKRTKGLLAYCRVHPTVNHFFLSFSLPYFLLVGVESVGKGKGLKSARNGNYGLNFFCTDLGVIRRSEWIKFIVVTVLCIRYCNSPTASVGENVLFKLHRKRVNFIAERCVGSDSSQMLLVYDKFRGDHRK